MYTRTMLSQNTRLHYLGRLAQEYALVQHSRQVRRRPQRKTGPGAEGAPREAQPIPTGAAGAPLEAQPGPTGAAGALREAQPSSTGAVARDNGLMGTVGTGGVQWGESHWGRSTGIICVSFFV